MGDALGTWTTTKHVNCLHTTSKYCIVGNFRGRKLFTSRWKMRFLRRKLSWIACWCRRQKTPRPQFCRENFREWLQSLKICKSFLPLKFLTIWYIYYEKDFSHGVHSHSLHLPAPQTLSLGCHYNWKVLYCQLRQPFVRAWEWQYRRFWLINVCAYKCKW